MKYPAVDNFQRLILLVKTVPDYIEDTEILHVVYFLILKKLQVLKFDNFYLPISKLFIISA